jgi:uncharacterized protein YndB with AHSA1/START domain
MDIAREQWAPPSGEGIRSRKGPPMREDDEHVRREVEIEACPEEVWEALADEERREHWLDYDPERDIHVEVSEEPRRLVWQWGQDGEQSTRVEFLLLPTPAGARVIVTETAPSFPIEMFASSFALVMV